MDKNEGTDHDWQFYKKDEKYMWVDDNPLPLQIVGGNQLLEAPKSAAIQSNKKNTQGQKRASNGNDNKANKKSRLFNSS